MIYPYANAAGERREISASMKSPPPERIVFNGDEWRKARARDPEASVFQRVWAECVGALRVVDYEINYPGKPPPISRSATPHKTKGDPVRMFGQTVYRQPGGSITDAHGRPYIRNRTDIDNHCRATGDTWD